MKLLTILFILIIGLSVFGQTKKLTNNDNIQVVIKDDGVTSELLPITIGMPSTFNDAKIGIKYFGPTNEADISFLLLLKAVKSRYNSDESFGVRLIVDDLPISSSKYRLINSVKKRTGEITIQFNITTEDLAWMATADNLKITTYNVDTETKLDTFTFSVTGLTQLKKFAKSVYLIRSTY